MSDNITLPREVAKLALDHIEWYIENERGGRFAEEREAAEALRTALAAPSEDIDALRRENERLRELLTEAKDLAWSFGADSLFDRIEAALQEVQP